MAQRHQYKVFKALLQSLLRSYCTAKGPYKDLPEMHAHSHGKTIFFLYIIIML